MVDTDGKFFGTFCRILDAKGRLVLPPAFIQALDKNKIRDNSSFWLTSIYGRLTAYLPREWENTVEQLCSVKMPSLKLSNFKTKLIGMAQEIIPDSQGRIRIPQSLMREAGLQKNIVLVGVLDKFEIWDQTRFDAVAIEDVADELTARDINISF